MGHTDCHAAATELVKELDKWKGKAEAHAALAVPVACTDG